MIKSLISLNTPAATEKIRQLLSIPQVKEMAHKKIGSGLVNELLQTSRRVDNTAVTDLLLEIPNVLKMDNMLEDRVAKALLRQEEAEPHYFGLESAQAANNPTEQSKLKKLLSHYPINPHSPHPTDQLISELEKRYASDPAVITRDDDSLLQLPLKWDDFKDLKLSAAEMKRALSCYYKNINHTAWRFLHPINPWMIEGSDFRTHSERYKNTIGQLWLAANDSDQRPLDSMSLEGRVNEFIARINDMGRSNNILDDNNMGDYPVCKQGMLGQLVFAVCRHPLYRVISPADIQARFNEYLKDAFARKITDANQKILKDTYKKMLEIDDLTPEEIAAAKALDLLRAELEPFVDHIKLVYGDEYARSAEFNSFLDKELSLGIYNSQLEKYASVLHLEKILSSPPVQTQKFRESAAETHPEMKMRGPS